MSLFERKTDYGKSEPLYNLSSQKNLVIIGLGNTGKEYDGSRHNIGFACIDSLAEKLEFPSWVEKKDLKCLFTHREVNGAGVILIKPTTFMNLSGEAAQAVSHFYKIPPAQIVAIYDELDIPFGQIRTRVGGTSAGHNGVESLLKHIGKDFGRVRIGVKNKLVSYVDSKDFVLDKFTKEEIEQLPALKREANAILSEHIYGQPLSSETRSFLV